MKELLRFNDAVLLSLVEALLAAAGIQSLVLDRHTSILEGRLGVLPRRLMVGDDDDLEARRILSDAGIAAHGGARA